MVVFMFNAKIVTGGAGGAFCTEKNVNQKIVLLDKVNKKSKQTADLLNTETLLGLSQMASNLHQDDGGSLADTIFISSQHGPLIFWVNKNLSKLD